jgi:diguanylate cyclase (GGDEF)-like protein
VDLTRPESLVPIIVGLSALLVGIGLGVLISFSRGRHGSRKLQQELGQVEREYKETVRTAKRLRTDYEALSRFLVFLPDFTRRMNQDLARETVLELLSEALHRIFEPEQVCVFRTERRGGSLVLASAQGVSGALSAGDRVRIGEGRIGWVAEHLVSMATEDFLAQSRIGQRPIDADPPGLQVDLAAPMVHNNRLQGVLAVGGIPVHLRAQKPMIKMVADMGSNGLSNADLFSQLQQQAHHDGLTHLANKKFFMRKLGIMINEAETAGRPLGVFIFDIDHFKSYNDQNGHLAGDELLRQLGRLVRETLRENDLAARYGGEEFIVALPDTDRTGAMVAAETFRRKVEQFHFPNQSNQPNGNLTISGGLAVFPVDGRTSTELISHADQALYTAKAQGRNRIIAYESPEFGDGRPHSFYEENLGS